MPTKTDAEDQDAIPDLSGVDWNTVAMRRLRPAANERTEVRLDGAVEYQLRLIPSTRVIGRFATTLDAWPAILAAADSGRSPRTLSLDAIGPSGQRWHMAAGDFLVTFARLNNGPGAPALGITNRPGDVDDHGDRNLVQTGSRRR
jgi:hypothetical protein